MASRQGLDQTADPDNQARDDYAVISRPNPADNAGGKFILSIAGIRMYGTRAAAELISDPVRLNSMLSGLPKGWETGTCKWYSAPVR